MTDVYPGQGLFTLFVLGWAFTYAGLVLMVTPFVLYGVSQIVAVVLVGMAWPWERVYYEQRREG